MSPAEYYPCFFALKKGELARQAGNDCARSHADNITQSVFQLHLAAIDVVTKYPTIIQSPHSPEHGNYESGVLLGRCDSLDELALQQVRFWMMKFAIEDYSPLGAGQCRQESLPTIRVDEHFNKSLFVRIHQTSIVTLLNTLSL